MEVLFEQDDAREDEAGCKERINDADYVNGLLLKTQSGALSSAHVSLNNMSEVVGISPPWRSLKSSLLAMASNIAVGSNMTALFLPGTSPDSASPPAEPRTNLCSMR